MYDKITINEFIDNLKKDSVDFINLQFSDIMGATKSVTIPTHKMPEALEHGIWFDGSSVEGFTRIFESDMRLIPDLSTYSIIPWLKSDSNVGRIICDVKNPDGSPFESDPRYILKSVIKEANDLGYEFYTGPELEFFLFKMENGKIRTTSNQKIEPHDNGEYFDLVMDLGFQVRKDMMIAMEKMGLEVEASHHEVAPGQHEIDFKYGKALQTADRVQTMKYTLKAIAAQYGLHVTFMPKPISGINGSGMHVHQSLFSLDGKTNLFFDNNDKYKLSNLAYSFLAGQIAYAKPMCAILNPTVNSYKRLVPGYEAASYICWAQTNRSALIRVPMYTPGKEKATRIEIRNPDPTANPYLAFAILLKAGLEGIKNNLTPPEPVEENVFEFDAVELKEYNIDTLPYSLKESLDLFKNEDVINSVLGKTTTKKYLRAKNKEWDKYRLAVTDWEIKNYL